jgi:hypothetical protein
MRAFIKIVLLAVCAALSSEPAPLWAVGSSVTQPDAVTPDGGRYYGPLVDGMRQGHGRIEWNNGSSYEGEFEQGLYSSHGRLKSSDGSVYDGAFVDGTMTGHGHMTELDGSIYEGEFTNDAFNGHGRNVAANGDVSEGNFENGHLEGQGSFVGGGLIYHGEFSQGLFAGTGELVYDEGRVYQGQLRNGRLQGKGRLTNSNGDIYEGDFDQDQFTGNGTVTRKDGSTHRGAFEKWIAHGRGTYTDGVGNVYEGEFVHGALSGTGLVTGKDGNRYDGEFKAWRFNGHGALRLASGDVYTGAFVDGMYEGEGTLVYAKPRADGRTQDSGTWHFGRLKGAEDDRRTRVSVESALYNQRALLDAALAGVGPRDPNRINLYFLGIAGDGSQEVFRREVDFVRAEFDRSYGTQGRSLSLINSRNTLDSAPMATMTSIREALSVIASRMDKEKDILFVYLTSHGSEEHDLTLDVDGMNLRSLPAKELGSLLAATGVRWKVVVVSACYAGGFIDYLKDDSTLAIAAARRDRRSFGCADENDFTYFGRAYFKESLPESDSFEQAFHKAETLVAQWEERDQTAAGKKDESSNSYPQMYDTPAIEAYLKTWRKQSARPQ